MGTHEAANGSEQYALTTGRAGEQRLRLLHTVYGPSTERLLDGLDLQPGMSVADIGCGVGVVACWLAGRVGAAGTVVGVDASVDQLVIARQEARVRGLTQLQFVEANAYSTGLSRAAFDLVYCRSLLSHLRYPGKALGEMSALVKPGGWLVCEDIDMASLSTQPPTAAYARVVKILLDLGRVREADYRIGSNLQALFQAAGYPEPHVSLDQPVFQTGESKRLWEYTFLELA